MAGFSNVGYDEAMRRARECVPLLLERAQKCEDARVLLPENEKLLHETGLFRYHQPKIFGGMELPFVAVVDLCAELARGCQPDQLRFPRGKDGDLDRSGGTLTLRCLGAMALELQHQTPMLLERINSYFGYRAVAQLRLVQGSLRRHPQRKTAKLPPLAPADRAATEAQLAPLPEGEVKDALRRLGDAIQQRSKLPTRS